MAPVTVYLVDKSAWEWARRDEASATDLVGLLREGHILAGSHVTALEMAYSARTADDHTKIISRQRGGRWLSVTEQVMDRALEVVALLARRGQHRVPIPDVIIAATAEHHESTVLHVDKDYRLIAEVTGQPMRRLATSA